MTKKLKLKSRVQALRLRSIDVLSLLPGVVTYLLPVHGQELQFHKREVHEQLNTSQ